MNNKNPKSLYNQNNEGEKNMILHAQNKKNKNIHLLPLKKVIYFYTNLVIVIHYFSDNTSLWTSMVSL